MSRAKLVGWEDVCMEPAEGTEGRTYDEVWMNVMKPLLDSGTKLEDIKKRIRESLQDWNEHTEIAFSAVPNLRFDSVLATNVNAQEVYLYVRFTPIMRPQSNEKGFLILHNVETFVDATVEAIFQKKFLFSNSRELKSFANLDDFLALAHLKKAQLATVLGD